MLENIVYLELRRRGAIAGYHVTATGREVDFVAVDPAGERHFVQVCATLGDAETRDRELRSLAEAMAETKVGRAVIVTLTNDGVERFEGHVVRVIPAWRWLLEA